MSKLPAMRWAWVKILTLFGAGVAAVFAAGGAQGPAFVQAYLQRLGGHIDEARRTVDRKSTRLNSSHDQISYAVFCFKKKKKKKTIKGDVVKTT